MTRRRRRGSTPEAQLAEGIAHHRAGRLEDAARAYDAVLDAAPGLAAAHEMKGVLALQNGAQREALVSLDRALAIDASRAGTHLNRGNALRGLGRLGDAEAAYRGALELDADLAIAHNNLGNVLRDESRLAEALPEYARALEIDPDFFAAAANKAQTLSKHVERSEGEVLAAYERAAAIAERQGIRGVAVANCLNGRANLYRSMGRLEEAIEGYRRAVEHDPDFSEAHLNLGRALAGAKRFEEAIDPTRRSISLRPSNVQAYKVLGVLLRRLGRREEAAEVYRAWRERDPVDPVAAHMAAALGDEIPPPRASDAYIRREFDDFAENFERVLALLEYRAPQLIEETLREWSRSHDVAADVLDVGCGTGLCGPFLRGISARLVGVDLSAGMLEVARQRQIYDELVEAELMAYARGHPEEFDLVVAADVFIYFGDLEPPLRSLRSTLRRGGTLAFTVEAGDEAAGDYRLNPGGRYEHSRDYVRSSIDAAGLELRSITHGCLRRELAEDVSGWVVVAERPQRS